MAVLGILAAVGLAAILWTVYGLIFCRASGEDAVTLIFSDEDGGPGGKLMWARCFFAGSELFVVPKESDAVRQTLRDKGFRC